VSAAKSNEDSVILKPRDVVFLNRNEDCLCDLIGELHTAMLFWLGRFA
jgi:hypothetical protein